MRQITDFYELRQIQLRIMDRIHKFCLEKGLEYSLSSGTLLGAVRHGGYIPWDDDIDIYMPRESYDKLVRLWDNSVDNYKIVDKYHDSKYPYSFPKIIDNDTILIEDAFPKYKIGVWVDVFPVDGLPNNLKARSLYFIINRYFTRVMWNRNSEHPDKGLLHKFRYYISKYCPISNITALKIRDYILSKCKNTTYVMHLTEAGPATTKSCFKRELMSSFDDIKFEDRTYKAMIGKEEYLSATYGDFMQLPPVDKRKRHYFTAYYK